MNYSVSTTSSRENHPFRALSHESKSRRYDIQGLRAIAVIAVVIYHADFPLPGGFTGVDIFFVISGFVITQMLIREMRSTGGLRLKRFFVRRFKRLTPALAVVVTFTLIGSFLLQSPMGEQKSTAATAVGSLTLLANAVIFRATGGYFEPEAETNPLLHTWSLAVEEQFYLFFPFALYGAWLLGRKWKANHKLLFIVSASFSIASFALLIASVNNTPIPVHPFVTSFYSPFVRGWEFGIGVLVALLPASLIPHYVGRVLGSAVGFTLIGVSFFCMSEELAIPGPILLVPTLGTALIIYCGGHEENPVNRIISGRGFQFLGDISYSWYLWHWPFIVFAALLFPDKGQVLLAAGLVSIVPAIISYRYIEEPLRNIRFNTRRGLMFLASFTVIPVFLLAGILLAGSSAGWGNERVKTIQALHPGWSDCMSFATMPNGPDANPSYADCSWNQTYSQEPVYLVGDSNASQFSTSLIEATRNSNSSLTMRTAGGCPFIDTYRQVGAAYDGPDKLCREYYESTLEWLQHKPAGTVVMASTEGYWIENNMLIGIDKTALHADVGARTKVLTDGMISTVQTLQAAGHDVVIVSPIPHPSFAGHSGVPTKCSTFAIARGECGLTVPLSDIDRVQSPARSTISRTSEITNAQVLDLRSWFCNSVSCSLNKDGELLYQDSLHITVDTSKNLSDSFEQVLRR